MPNLSLTLHAGIERALGRSLTWRLGRWLYLGSRRELINDPRLNGEYALQDWLLDAALKRAAPDRPLVFVDVGANVGHWAERLLRAVEAREQLALAPVTMHAFEPAPAQRDSLRQRLRPFETRATVRIDARGLAAETGAGRLVLHGDMAGSNALAMDEVAGDDPGEAVEIEIATLDQISADNGYDGLFFVKVDTEGNDFNVIRGAQRLFQAEAVQAMQFEYNWRWIEFGHSLKDVFRFFDRTNYLIAKLTSENVEIYDRWHQEIERYTETNYLILHRDLAPDLPCWRAQFDRFNTLSNGKASPPPMRRTPHDIAAGQVSLP